MTTIQQVLDQRGLAALAVYHGVPAGNTINPQGLKSRIELFQELTNIGQNYTEATDLTVQAVPGAVTVAICNAFFLNATGTKPIRCLRIQTFCYPPAPPGPQQNIPLVAVAPYRPIQLKDCKFVVNYSTLDSTDLFNRLIGEMDDHLDSVRLKEKLHERRDNAPVQQLWTEIDETNEVMIKKGLKACLGEEVVKTLLVEIQQGLVQNTVIGIMEWLNQKLSDLANAQERCDQVYYDKLTWKSHAGSLTEFIGACKTSLLKLTRRFPLGPAFDSQLKEKILQNISTANTEVRMIVDTSRNSDINTPNGSLRYLENELKKRMITGISNKESQATVYAAEVQDLESYATDMKSMKEQLSKTENKLAKETKAKEKLESFWTNGNNNNKGKGKGGHGKNPNTKGKTSKGGKGGGNKGGKNNVIKQYSKVFCKHCYKFHANKYELQEKWHKIISHNSDSCKAVGSKDESSKGGGSKKKKGK